MPGKRTTSLGAIGLAAALFAAGCSSGGDDSVGEASPSPSTSPSASAALWTGPAITTTPMSDADAKAIDEAVAAALAADQDGATGFIAGIWDPEKGFHIAAAGTVAKDGAPITPETHMYIGSISKTATAAAVLQLVDQGKLSLDATVAEVVPDIAKEFPAVASVPVRRLLDMSSGIPDYINLETGGILPEIWKDPQVAFTSNDLIKAALDATPVATAGTTGYSNTNYIMLGEILAKVTGKTPAAAVNDMLGQLGLTQTTLPDPTAPLPDPGSHGYYGASESKGAKAAGYPYGADTDVTDWNKSWAGTAGAISTTAAEMATFAGSAFGSTLLSKDLVADRLTGVSLGDFSMIVGLYGLGIGVRGDWVGHEGQLIGWEAYSFYNTKTGATFALLTNSSGSVAELFSVLAPYYPEMATFYNPAPGDLSTVKNFPADYMAPEASAAPSAS